jgi:cytoskeletal protein RodZ
MENLLSIPAIGDQLRQQREAQSLTVNEVANVLCLNKQLITDLEEGNCNHIPATYYKGYIRAYAKLLAFSNWQELNVTAGYPETTVTLRKHVTKKQISAGDHLVQWITFSIITLLVLLVVLWWRSDKLLYENLSSNDAPDQLYRIAQNDNTTTTNRGQ